MKMWNCIVLGYATLLLTVTMIPAISFAAFVSGSTGADGDFTPTVNTVLQISESGVFNYGTVNIPSGVTVTFTKNSANTPVTILATGDVTIAGTVSVSGSNGNYIVPGAGGVGGFDGGQSGTPNQTGKRGGGQGGGTGGTGQGSYNYAGNAGGGGFGANGSAGGVYSGWSNYPSGVSGGLWYGNSGLIPLIGGSGGGGGGGSSSYNGGGGGGGGGSIVIASSGTLTVSGSITANGGSAANGEGTSCNGWSNSYYGGGGGGGSGGGIRLVANTIAGNGTISATGGSGGLGCGTGSVRGGAGGVGRIRLEATNILRTTATTPPFTTGNAYSVVPTNMPILSIVSVGGIDVPGAPKGSFSSPDVLLPYNVVNPLTIVISGTNVPLDTTVTVKATPSVGSASSATATLTGADESATSASLSLNISKSYPSIITASVTYQVTAANGGPIYAEGERVDKIRVAANLGGKSNVTYITESGREIPAVM